MHAERYIFFTTSVCASVYLDARGQLFPVDLRNYVRAVLPRTTKFGVVERPGPASPAFWDPTYAHTVWLRATKFGMVMQVEKRCFSMVGHAPPILRGGPQCSNNFETSSMRAHGMRNNNHILHGDQTKWEDNFTCPGKIFVSRICWRAFCLQYLTLLLKHIKDRLCWNFAYFVTEIYFFLWKEWNIANFHKVWVGLNLKNKKHKTVAPNSDSLWRDFDLMKYRCLFTLYQTG